VIKLKAGARKGLGAPQGLEGGAWTGAWEWG